MPIASTAQDYFFFRADFRLVFFAVFFAAVFVFDFAFELLPVVAVAPAPLFVVSVVAGFFFAFFFAVVLASLWSVEGAAPDCCAPRITDALPKTSNMAAMDARISPLFDLNKVFSPRCGCLLSATRRFPRVGSERGQRGGTPYWNARMIAKKRGEVKVKAGR